MAKNRTTRIVGRIVKYLCIAVVFAVIAFLLWRAFVSDVPPDSMNDLVMNDALAEAYEKEGKLTLTYKEYDNATRADKNYGYFFITRVDIIPEANQIQLVLRYNNSTVSSLKKDYGLEKEPAREEDLFDLTLVSVTDLTPENKNDNAAKDFDPEVMKKTRYFPTESYTVSDQKNMYNYRKFVFEDVPIEELTLALYVDIYYNEDINYENDAYGTLCIWDYLAYDRSHELTANDIKALENWRKK